jgi:hypothetical protein
MQTTTSELLREWRDWSRALRQGIATDLERAELIRSELRVRGVLLEEDMGGGSLANQVVGQEVRQGEAEPDDLAADAILEQARELQALANRIYAHATARLRASRRLTVLTGLFLLAAIAALIGGWP